MNKSSQQTKFISHVLYCLAKIIICLVLIGLSIAGVFFLTPAKLNYHVIEKVLITNLGDEAAIYFSLMTPKSGPYQSVSEINIDWDGDYQNETFDTVETHKFSVLLVPETSIEVTLQYEVSLKQGKASWTREIETFQTLPQAGIESEHILIQNQADEITKNLLGNLSYKIYAFTTKHLSYSQAQEDCAGASAIKSYQMGSCFCAGFARLMVALSRAAGVPSQVVVGFLYPDPLVRKPHIFDFENPGEAHAWVEINNFGKWTLADPTLGNGGWKRVFFGRNDGRHIVYGELEEIYEIHQAQKYWVFNQTDNPESRSECFRVVADATSQDVEIKIISSVEKVWDGRWFNAILAWIVMVVLLCRLRSWLIK